MLKNGAIGVRKCPPPLKSHLNIYKRIRCLETHLGQKGGGKGEKGCETGGRGRTGGGEKIGREGMPEGVLRHSGMLRSAFAVSPDNMQASYPAMAVEEIASETS